MEKVLSKLLTLPLLIIIIQTLAWLFPTVNQPNQMTWDIFKQCVKFGSQVFVSFLSLAESAETGTHGFASRLICVRRVCMESREWAVLMACAVFLAATALMAGLARRAVRADLERGDRQERRVRRDILGNMSWFFNTIGKKAFIMVQYTWFSIHDLKYIF